MSSPARGAARVKAVIFDMGGILEGPFDDVLFPELARTLGERFGDVEVWASERETDPVGWV